MHKAVRTKIFLAPISLKPSGGTRPGPPNIFLLPSQGSRAVLWQDEARSAAWAQIQLSGLLPLVPGSFFSLGSRLRGWRTAQTQLFLCSLALRRAFGSSIERANSVWLLELKWNLIQYSNLVKRSRYVLRANYFHISEKDCCTENKDYFSFSASNTLNKKWDQFYWLKSGEKYSIWIKIDHSKNVSFSML